MLSGFITCIVGLFSLLRHFMQSACNSDIIKLVRFLVNKSYYITLAPFANKSSGQLGKPFTLNKVCLSSKIAKHATLSPETEVNNAVSK